MQKNELRRLFSKIGKRTAKMFARKDALTVVTAGLICKVNFAEKGLELKRAALYLA